MYTNYFWRWLDYFKEIGVTQPVGLRREHVINYLEWRKKHGGERNTAIHEIKFLGFIMVCERSEQRPDADASF